ncbi:hypothetical protein CES86_1174 [Brucella lupini]|uniref:Uncharacterized protein n=1 Tax=Brucella lupini TaxID=255457 RepID=A0A256GVL8_9HYPH|nr:hypothetical protein CES86_1174 [Brucella lupini]
MSGGDASILPVIYRLLATRQRGLVVTIMIAGLFPVFVFLFQRDLIRKPL